MDSIAETQLRKHVALLTQRIQGLDARIDELSGALLANNMAVQVLIATAPDLERLEKNLKTAEQSLQETAQPASASLALGFRSAFDHLLARLENAKRKRAEQGQSAHPES